MTLPKPPTLSRKPMPDLKDYMTTEEAAKALGFHVITVRQMVRDGKLEGVKLGPGWLVLRKSVTDYKKRTEGMSKNDPRRGEK
ncbi:MAG: helix-turn-helix domain-containing protein [Chloroflexi bacterium]|nr:helix-turn-helix domain-containing protein [Chloroflexota bacterium]